MASLNQIADSVSAALGDENNYSLKERIKFTVKYYRARFLRNDIEKNGLAKEYIIPIQAELILVDKLDSCYIELGCKILRTKNRIPKPLRLKNDSLFKFAGSIDHSIIFTYTEAEELQFTKFNRFTSDVGRYWIFDYYVYVAFRKGFKWLGLDYVPLNPEEAIKLCDKECYDDDMEFPLPEDMLVSIIQGMLKGEFAILNVNQVNVETPLILE